jgi:hypothetical protein
MKRRDSIKLVGCGAAMRPLTLCDKGRAETFLQNFPYCEACYRNMRSGELSLGERTAHASSTK